MFYVKMLYANYIAQLNQKKENKFYIEKGTNKTTMYVTNVYKTQLGCHQFSTFDLLFFVILFYFRERERANFCACVGMMRGSGNRRGKERLSGRLMPSAEPDAELDLITWRF